MQQYIVDAFAEKPFEGNPAAVCLLSSPLEDRLMQAIAAENNLSETAFILPIADKGYQLRWFTPQSEIDLCGHATLASAFVLMNEVKPSLQQVHFHTQSGRLDVYKKGDQYEMAFPAYSLEKHEVTAEICQAIGVSPVEVWLGRDLVCVLEEEQQVRNLQPDLAKVKALAGLLLHVTAKGKDYDCVSRSFAPKVGVVEDPVCGSGHCHLVPLWANKLNQTEIIARQASQRGGTLYCRLDKDKVYLAGKAVLFARASLCLD